MNILTSRPRTQTNANLAKFLCLGLALHGIAGCSENESRFPEVGEPFPITALDQSSRLSGKPIDTRGKTLLINFWATWCAPCRDEMPDLQRLSEDPGLDDFAVIGVSVDDDSNLVREFLLQYDIRFPILLDDNRQLASELLGIAVYPTTYVVSPQGVIQARIEGIHPWDRNALEQITGSHNSAGKSVRPQQFGRYL